MKTFSIRFEDPKRKALEDIARINYTKPSNVVRAAVDGLIAYATANGGRLPLAPAPGGSPSPAQLTTAAAEKGGEL